MTGIPEILDEGAAGRLVPERDAAALADTLAELLDDADARAGLAAAGLTRAHELFDIVKNTQVLHGWHTEALAAAARS